MVKCNPITRGFILASLARSVHSQCDIPPLKLAWSNTTVTESGLGVARGIEIGIGTPNQIFAFRPSSTLNNTRVNNVLACGSAANDSCIGGLGGGFTPSKSRTYSVSIRAQWNGSQIDAQSATGAYVYFNDEVDFQQNGHVEGFPLVMDSQSGGGAQSSLPLGTNSSFLRAAVAGGVAPSEVFGLWTGSRGIDPVDGLLVVGGYDDSRVAGPFTNFSVGNWSLEKACPLQVTIADISYGGQSLFANSSETIIACIEPQTQRFVFTPDIATQFAFITGQNSTAYKGMQYNVTQRPFGNLTIKLDNGYTSTISNDELFTPLRGSDEYGRYAIINSSIVEAGVADTRKNDLSDVIPTLGGLFLTFNYLVVDYANGVFSLAPAVPSTSTDDPMDIKTVCTPSNSPAPAPSASPPSEPKSKKESNVGAIAGGTVGGVAGLSILALVALLAIRYRRRHAPTHSAETSAILSPVSHVRSGLSEMGASAAEEVKPVDIIHELPTSRNVSVRRPEGWEGPAKSADSNQT